MKEFKTKRGKTIYLLNPSEKSQKYANELLGNLHLTNQGGAKIDEYNQPIDLTPGQRAYRAGYLDARSDSSKVYVKQNGLVSKRKPRIKN